LGKHGPYEERGLTHSNICGFHVLGFTLCSMPACRQAGALRYA
jgi:hypothetical protein